jgi:hypothetical protein
MDDIEQRLISYIEASRIARGVLSELRGFEISSLDIQAALAEVLNIPENPPLGVLDQGLDAEKIIGHPEVLAEFISEEPLIPEGIPRLLTEQTVKVKGEVWRIHKNDVDPFPSVPHAHNYESEVVLHLGSGEMFDKNRQSIGNIGCKKLLRVRDKLSSLMLPTTECK